MSQLQYFADDVTPDEKSGLTEWWTAIQPKVEKVYAICSRCGERAEIVTDEDGTKRQSHPIEHGDHND